MSTAEERRHEQHQRRRQKAEKTARKPSGNGHAAEGKPGTEPWRKLLLLTKEGEVRDCLANAAHILRHDPAFQGRLRYNAFLEAAVTRDMPWRPGDEWREWTETDDIKLADWCQQRRVPLRPGTVADGVASVSDENRFHPVREYLESREWDGKKRIGSWLITYLGAEVPDGETEGERDFAKDRRAYLRAIGGKWLIQAVARILQPGCQADQALILEGKQRAKKSSAFEALCPNPAWFTDSISELGTKDSAQDLPGKWIVEMGELSAMKRGEIERIKGFISRKVDHYRPSYGKRSRDFPRQSVLGGTTNNDEYLRDTTGNRRFWGVKVGKIALERLRRERDQLWAEATAAFKAGEQWWLSDKQEKLAEVEQEQRRERHPWEDIILDWIKDETETSVRALLNRLGFKFEDRDQKHANKVVEILTSAGWWQKQVRNGHKKPRVYYPPSKPKSQPKRRLKPKKA